MAMLKRDETPVAPVGSDLNALHERARDSADLENLIKGLGAGIGDVTVTIFLRELRTVWPKARPPLSPPALLASGHLKLVGGGEAAGGARTPLVTTSGGGDEGEDGRPILGVPTPTCTCEPSAEGLPPTGGEDGGDGGGSGTVVDTGRRRVNSAQKSSSDICGASLSYVSPNATALSIPIAKG